MRFNVKFTIESKGEVENKFEVLESNSKHDKVNAKMILSKKYPEYEIEILKISQTITATTEII